MDSLDGLRTFASVVESGSFTAAADRLGMSKKLASKYVAELELRLGVKLLHRTTRSLSLTSAGHKFYPKCIALLEDFDAMAAEIREDEIGLKGILRVSAPVTFGEIHLQYALAEFQAMHPDLTVDLRLNDRFVDLIAEGFDLAIRIGALEDSSLVSKRLSTTDLRIVASPDYLDRMGTPKTPSDLLNHNCIRDSNLRSELGWPLQINGQEQRLFVSGSFIVNSATAVRRLALNGNGIGLCPSYAVADCITSGQLVQMLTDHPSRELVVQAVFADARRMPARTRALLNFLGSYFRSPAWRPSVA
ncbi:MAG: LysR family transcriptional regulator [Pseudomonadota bacterium]